MKTGLRRVAGCEFQRSATFTWKADNACTMIRLKADPQTLATPR
jgi:hypothetical protein